MRHDKEIEQIVRSLLMDSFKPAGEIYKDTPSKEDSGDRKLMTVGLIIAM